MPPAATKRTSQAVKVAAPTLSQLEQMISRFASTPLRVDTSKLSPGDRDAVIKLIQAARILDDVFMEQYWSGDKALYTKLQKDKSALGKARLHYFWINKSPWSTIDEFKAFIPGVPPRKLPGANFYPEDLSKEEFEKWVGSLSEKEQADAKGFFTVIRRKASGLVAIPSSEEYKDDLTRAAAFLREAANSTSNDSLRKFLNL